MDNKKPPVKAAPVASLRPVRLRCVRRLDISSIPQFDQLPSLTSGDGQDYSWQQGSWPRLKVAHIRDNHPRRERGRSDWSGLTRSRRSLVTSQDAEAIPSEACRAAEEIGSSIPRSTLLGVWS